MSPRVLCQCGTSYELRDEFAGRLVKCPQCGRENRVPGAAVAAQPQADAAFDRDIFLLRQQMLRISEKYDVGDEQGNRILYVERPAHFLRNLGAVLAAAVVFFGVLVGVVVAIDAVLGPNPQGGAVAVVMLLAFGLAAAAALVVGVPLSAKRHVTFYRDANKRERLLDVLQDAKFQPITHTYTVRDAQRRPLARLRKNILYNLIRKRWYCDAPDGRPLAVAKEDSIILSLLRRLLGPFFGLLRTNFLILRPDSDDEFGEFKRKFTIRDRYVLDLTPDRARTFDRRIALALGVMLDTGERR